MVYFFKKLLAMPLRLIWLILAIVPFVSAPTWMTRWICRLDPSPQNTLVYLAAETRGRDYAYVRAVGEPLYEAHPSCQLASFVGRLAMHHGQIDQADQWCQIAQAFDQQEDEQLLQLEMSLSVNRGDSQDEAIAERILARRDLSMQLTRTALEVKAYRALVRHQWHDADAILERIFAIEDPPSLRWMRWVAAAGMGDHPRADRLFHEAWRRQDPKAIALYQAYGWYILGDAPRGQAALEEAVTAGAPPEVIHGLCRSLSVPVPSHLRRSSEEAV